MDDEDFQQEIQDDPHTQLGLPAAAEKVLSIRHDSIWSGVGTGGG